MLFADLGYENALTAMNERAADAYAIYTSPPTPYALPEQPDPSLQQRTFFTDSYQVAGN